MHVNDSHGIAITHASNHPTRAASMMTALLCPHWRFPRVVSRTSERDSKQTAPAPMSQAQSSRSPSRFGPAKGQTTTRLRFVSSAAAPV
eukprot:1278623-Prymnesium_polylepis.1